MSSTPVVTPAESAPAPETVETPEISVQDRLDHASAKELDTWRKTGDIPAVKVKAPEPIKTEIEAKPDVAPPSKSEPAAASPAAPPQKQESRSEKRYREITRDNRVLRERLEAIERKTSQPAAEPSAKPASQPAAAEKATEKQARPKLSDSDSKTGKPFASIDAWQDAVDEWKDQQFEAKLSDRLGKADQERTQTEQQRAKNEAIAAKLLPGREKYPDFDKVAFNPDLLLPLGSPADEFIRNSDHAADLLYHLGQNPEVLKGFYRYIPGKDDAAGKLTGTFEQLVTPSLQMIELAKIEARLSVPEVKPKQDAPAPANPAPPKLPPPPPELGGRHATVGDEAEKALARGDFATWKRLTDKREIAASKR